MQHIYILSSLLLSVLLLSCESKTQQKSSSSPTSTVGRVKFYPKHHFKDYSVQVSPLSNASGKKLSFTGNTSRHKTLITEGAKQSINFAGHYRIVEWGEGTGVGRFAVVDYQSGKVYEGLPFGPCGLTYQVDSRLLIIDLHELDENGEYPSDIICSPKIYIWTSNQWKRVE